MTVQELSRYSEGAITVRYLARTKEGTMSGTRTINGTYTSGVTLNTAYTTITGNSTITSYRTAVSGSSSTGLTLNNAGYINGYYGVYLAGSAATVTNTGTIQSYSYGAIVLTDGGSVNNASTAATISGSRYGVAISGGTGTVINVGHIRAIGGAAVQLNHGGTVSNAASGTLAGQQWGVEVSNGAGTVLNAGSIDGNYNFGIALSLGGYVSNAAGGTITGGHHGSPRNAVYVAGASGTVINNGFMAAYNSYGVYFKSGGTVTNAGTISGVGDAVKFAASHVNRLILDPGAVFTGKVDGGNTAGAAQASTLELASAASTGTLSGLGSKYIHFIQTTVDVGASWTLTGSNSVVAGYTLNNAGTLFDTGSLTIGGDLSGGRLVIAAGQTLIDAGTIEATATIAFNGNSGGVDLNAGHFSGVIGNFSSGDAISLTGVNNVVSYNVINGKTLELTRSDTSHLDLTFDREFLANQFSVTTSGSNTVITTDQVTCFASGTRLDTPDGEMAVESLTIGDLVLTASGEARAVRWIGHRHLDLARSADPTKVQPVRIMAGALAPCVPRRDLLVSPDHALLLDGVLIPARLLLNGVTILREEHWRSVTYYHIELDSHDVLLAEGAAAESYLDTGDRSRFANGGGPIALHPDFSARMWEAMGCAPLILTGPALASVQARLARRAEQAASWQPSVKMPQPLVSARPDTGRQG